LTEIRNRGYVEAVYKGNNNILALLELLIRLVLDVIKVSVSIVVKYDFNSMVLRIIVLGKPVLSFKSSENLLYLVVRVFPEDWL
jgi:hypothetical protein